MIRQQDAVGLTTFDTRMRVDMPARSSPRHFREMAAAGSVVPGGGTDIAETLHGLANRFKRRGLIVLISDLYGDPEAMVRALHHFRHRRHEMIVFHVLDPAEVLFPFRDLVAFRDLETGERIEIDPAFVRGQYLAEIETLDRNYRRACAERRSITCWPRRRRPTISCCRSTSPSGTAHDVRRAAVSAGRGRRRDPGPAAPDRPAAGEGTAVSHAPVPEASAEKTRRRKRIHDAALMLLRAAVLLLAAAGLARPSVTRLGRLWARPTRPRLSCSTIRRAWE